MDIDEQRKFEKNFNSFFRESVKDVVSHLDVALDLFKNLLTAFVPGFVAILAIPNIQNKNLILIICAGVIILSIYGILWSYGKRNEILLHKLEIKMKEFLNELKES